MSTSRWMSDLSGGGPQLPPSGSVGTAWRYTGASFIPCSIFGRPIEISSANANAGVPSARSKSPAEAAPGCHRRTAARAVAKRILLREFTASFRGEHDSQTGRETQIGDKLGAVRLEAWRDDPNGMSAGCEREGMSHQLRRRAERTTIKEDLSLQR